MTEPPAAEGSADDNAEETLRLANKWDPSEVKRVLDEFSAQVVLDAGYEEDMFVSNTKIGLGLLTCATALLAQFYPLSFPQNYTLLVACVVMYFVLNTALQAFVHLREGNVILSTRPKEGSSQLSGLALSSSLGKYSDEYSLTARACAARPASAPKPAELRKSITTWFYEDGELAQDVLKSDVLKLLSAFERAHGSRGKSE